MGLEITLQASRHETSPVILECINQPPSFVAFFLLTPQDNHLLLKEDMEDGYWYRGLKINCWSMRKNLL